MDTTNFEGIDQFGSAYQVLLENDVHAPGSVDRLVLDRMVRLCDETVGYLYSGYTSTRVDYQQGQRTELELHLIAIGAIAGSPADRIARIVEYCLGVVKRCDASLDEMLFGGTEEEIIARGSDWCTDIARVACAMCQIAGVPARLVPLINVNQAYSGHQIIEAFTDGVWGAADPTNGVVYRDADGDPVTTWELTRVRDLVAQNWAGRSSFYTDPDQFLGVAISNYYVSDADRFDYSNSRVNEYYRRILEMSDAGWPGGLRWIQGEGGG